MSFCGCLSKESGKFDIVWLTPSVVVQHRGIGLQLRCSGSCMQIQKHRAAAHASRHDIAVPHKLCHVLVLCRSVMAALQDPARQLQAFAFLVQKAALTTLMEDSKDALTLFAPDDKVCMKWTLDSASTAMLQRVVCSPYSLMPSVARMQSIQCICSQCGGRNGRLWCCA